MDLQPFQLLGVRLLRDKNGDRKQLLIQWQGLPEIEATWEEESQFRTTFPNFDLEDKVSVKQGSNDTSQSVKEASNTVGPSEAKATRPERVKRAPIWMSDYQ